MDVTTTDVTTTVDTYLAMWNEPDRATRLALIERAWTTEGRYVDPLQEAKGHDALSAMVDAIQEQFPGQRFRRQSGVDSHHDQVRFAWDLAAPDGAVTVAGLDVGVVADDGRLVSITGFFGDPPEDGSV
jgi:SnoaL-like domain